MKTLTAILAGVALIAAPVAAQAQHSGGHGGGGFHSGGGGGFHSGGGFHGGYGGYRGGYYGHGGYGYGWGGPFFFGAGFGLGLYAADPWFWGPGYGYYGYYGYPAYYDYDDGYDYAPPSSYYRGSMPDDDAAVGARAPAARSVAPQATACGSWHWDAAAQKYNWVTDGC